MELCVVVVIEKLQLKFSVYQFIWSHFREIMTTDCLCTI